MTVERYVWQRCAEGGQALGNLQEIRPSVECGAPWFEGWISQDNGRTWWRAMVGELDELRPPRYKFLLGWVIRVSSFDSPEAQAHIRVADVTSFRVWVDAVRRDGVLRGEYPSWPLAEAAATKLRLKGFRAHVVAGKNAIPDCEAGR